MNTREFLLEVLAEGNYYCLLALLNGSEGRRQTFYNSIDDLIEAAYEYDAGGWDAYVAMGTFAEKGSRTQKAVQNVKAFYFDLDVDPDDDKKYASQAEALHGLRSFCKDLRLPKPLIVDSGRGVHVHWPLAESVERERWEVVANRLKSLTKEKGLLADHAVTSDSARVLRIPNTHNHKTDPPIPVEFMYAKAKPVDVGEFAELLGYETIPVPSPVSGTNAVMDALISNRESSFDDIIAKSRNSSGCEQLRRVIDEPNTQSEPVWVSAMSIAKHCSDAGRETAHELSRGYEGYDPDETDTKYDNIKYPHTCSTFDDRVEGICMDCPNWGKVKSPIVLGSRVAESGEVVVQETAIDLPNAPVKEYTIPTYPEPYFRGRNGGVYIRTQDAEGVVDEKAIYHNDLYVMRRLKDIEVGEAIVMRLHLPKDGVREFTVPLTAVTSREEFRKAMSKEGVAVSKMDELMRYTTDWVNELQANSTADTAHREFGWTDENCTSFVLGNTEVTADELKFNPPSAPTAALFSAFEPRGTLEGWKEMAEFYNQPGMEMHQYVVGTAFGSALMELMPVQCAAIHIFSKDSGLGKTTAMLAAASVWGNPRELMLDRKDTHASKMNRAEIYHSLPFLVDEVTNAKGDELSDLLYQLSSGQQRARMSSGSNQERTRGRPFAFSSVLSGNTGIVESVGVTKNAPKAEAQRILECPAKKMHFASKKVTDDFARSVEENYAHVGIPYIQFIINNLAEIKVALDKIQTRIDTKAGLTAENRFWSAGVVTSLTGLIIAKKLGFVTYDLKNLEAWTVKLLIQNKEAMVEMDTPVEQLLNEFFNEHFASAIWINSTQDLRKGDNDGLSNLVIPDMMPKRDVLAYRYEHDIGRAYLVPKTLRLWCAKQQINYAQMVTDLQENMGAKKHRVRLYRGTKLNHGSQPCIVVDCKVDKPDEVLHGDGSVEDV